MNIYSCSLSGAATGHPPSTKSTMGRVWLIDGLMQLYDLSTAILTTYGRMPAWAQTNIRGPKAKIVAPRRNDIAHSRNGDGDKPLRVHGPRIVPTSSAT